MRRDKTRLLTGELVDECAAFLRGAYAGSLAERFRPVPVWGWTNLLAHASEAELRELIRARHRLARATGRWAHAAAYVAGEVLDLAERQGSLRQLQTALLIPLELELATRADTDTWGPRAWVTVVTTALGDHRRTCERRTRGRSREVRGG